MVFARDEQECYSALPVSLQRRDLLHWDEARGLNSSPPLSRDDLKEMRQMKPTHFMEPNSHKLTTIGTVRPCLSLFQPLYRSYAGYWWAPTPMLRIVPAPQTVETNDGWNHTAQNRQQPLNFSHGGIYQQEAVRRWEEWNRNKQVERELTYALAVQAQRPLSGHTWSPHSVFPHAFPSTTNFGFFSWLLRAVSTFGHYAAAVFGVFLIFKGITWLMGIWARWTTPLPPGREGPFYRLIATCLPSFFQFLWINFLNPLPREDPDENRRDRDRDDEEPLVARRRDKREPSNRRRGAGTPPPPSATTDSTSPPPPPPAMPLLPPTPSLLGHRATTSGASAPREEVLLREPGTELLRLSTIGRAYQQLGEQTQRARHELRNSAFLSFQPQRQQLPIVSEDSSVIRGEKNQQGKEGGFQSEKDFDMEDCSEKTQLLELAGMPSYKDYKVSPLPPRRARLGEEEPNRNSPEGKKSSDDGEEDGCLNSFASARRKLATHFGVKPPPPLRTDAPAFLQNEEKNNQSAQTVPTYSNVPFQKDEEGTPK